MDFLKDGVNPRIELSIVFPYSAIFCSDCQQSQWWLSMFKYFEIHNGERQNRTSCHMNIRYWLGWTLLCLQNSQIHRESYHIYFKKGITFTSTLKPKTKKRTTLKQLRCYTDKTRRFRSIWVKVKTLGLFL